MAAFIIYIIRWALCLTLLYSFFGLFLKRETLHGFNRVVLLAILLASMVLPLCQVKIHRSNIITENRGIIEQQLKHVQNPEFEYPERIVYHYDNSEVTYKTPPVRENMHLVVHATILVYLAGLLIAWGRYLWSLTALLLFIQRAKHVEIEGVPQGVRVLTHSAIKTPCSWMRWMILNPTDINMRPIISHELAHIRLGHSWDMLLCELTCRMLWFVPFAWMLRQDLRDVHEYQADRRVLQGGIKDEEYQLLLIKKATSTGLQPVVNALNQSPIKRRFKMMYRKPSRRWVALRAAYLLPLGTLALVAFARPQVLGEIEQKVEEAAPLLVRTAKTVKQQLPTLAAESKETVGDLTTSHHPSPVTNDNSMALEDMTVPTTAVHATHTPAEVLDSTMQAIGARRIGEGIYVGKFKPNYTSDTIRVNMVSIYDTTYVCQASHAFPQNTGADCYEVELQVEHRGELGHGYHLSRMTSNALPSKPQAQPSNAQHVFVVAPLTPAEVRRIQPDFRVERHQDETHVVFYFNGEEMSGEGEREVGIRRFANLWNHLLDADTGDRYMLRGVKGASTIDTTVTVNFRHDMVYQLTFIYPPLGKDVKRIAIAKNGSKLKYSGAFPLTLVEQKPRNIQY